MKVNDQGMVAVLVLKPFEMWLPPMKCGFFPSRAKDLIAQGFVELLEPAEEAGPEPVASEDAAKITKKPVASEDAAVAGPVAIPDDWRDSHHTQVIRLAKAILGKGKDVSVTRDEAIVVIDAEIARRAAAGTSEGEPK
jgi:hypothetical protein